MINQLGYIFIALSLFPCSILALSSDNPTASTLVTWATVIVLLECIVFGLFTLKYGEHFGKSKSFLERRRRAQAVQSLTGKALLQKKLSRRW